jgi:hypothetical protein
MHAHHDTLSHPKHRDKAGVWRPWFHTRFVTQAQNVLMKKMGLMPPEAAPTLADIARYGGLFDQPLSPSHCPYIVSSMLGASFDFDFLPANNTQGGILLAWCRDCRSLSNFAHGTFIITAQIDRGSSDGNWWTTVVYGPPKDGDLPSFFQELRDIRVAHAGRWLLMGDFNCYYQAADKNNPRINRRQMGRFKRLLDELELKEMHLSGRFFTWSNERSTQH